MCSIGGFISHKPLDPLTCRSICSALIWYGAERGNQSAGCYINGVTAKRAISPWEFIESEEYLGLFTNPSNMALTHTRQPTSGGLGDEQAQPFVSGQAVTVHNGFLLNISDLKREWNIQKPTGVDSELITQFLNTRGLPTFADFVESTEGVSAVAAIFHDKLYLIRSGNPTFFSRIMLCDDNCVTVFASTQEIVERVMYFTWLCPDINIQGTQQHVLLEVTPTKMRPISKKIRPTDSYYTDYNGRCYIHGMDAEGFDITRRRYDKEWDEALRHGKD